MTKVVDFDAYRAAYRIWMSDSEIAIPRSIKGTFDYYAGGEYVGKGSVHVLGEYVFYDSEDPRVAEWIFAARDTPEDAEEAEEDELGDWNDVSSKHHY